MEVRVLKNVYVLMFWANATIYTYPKTHIARVRHQTYFDPDSLLSQCNVVNITPNSKYLGTLN